MPITTDWYDETQQVIAQKFEGSWTWEELSREQDKLRTLAKSVDYKIALFCDMTNTNFMPRGNGLAQGRSAFTSMPDNISQFIIVIQSRMIEVFTRIALDMFPSWRNRIQIVKTAEQGQRL